MKLRLLSLFVAGALAGALATTGMQVYADKQAETKLPLMEVRQFTSVFNAVKDYYVDESPTRSFLSSPLKAWSAVLIHTQASLTQKALKT